MSPAEAAPRSPWLALVRLPRSAREVLVWLLSGWVLLFGQSYWDLFHGLWASDEQGHGPMILAVGLWLLVRRLMALQEARGSTWGLLPLGLGLTAYVLGRSQSIWTLEIGAQPLVLAGLVLAFLGWQGLRRAAFPLFFLLFMIPWPGDWTAALTTPLKIAVSGVASQLLYWAGYPVGQSGVVLTVGPYQLMVADACAGLNSLFTLEALGLLYMNVMQHTAVWRNTALALLVVPISFAANVLRVLVLVLVTYHFGDAAGQGFIHGFAGLLLMLAALLLIMAADGLLGRLARWRGWP
ncbi:exosortase B [Mitsuaria sp. WAJ17]|uniref:exosortase B n=1 Tax=Mitsuaria sp. WAJ17 TaxID=2761452 RepID=UPI002872C8F3|nr:exosortase B [Mitsuaria sp. WAJ17]